MVSSLEPMEIGRAQRRCFVESCLALNPKEPANSPEKSYLEHAGDPPVGPRPHRSSKILKILRSMGQGSWHGVLLLVRVHSKNTDQNPNVHANSKKALRTRNTTAAVAAPVVPAQ
mmetsp:Transcript_24241/g.55374  ORF Transcript_24241/g.55374 Transcript_24241/m.55374 type:complete len:115 (-) Transcript_24241:336-680(-)